MIVHEKNTFQALEEENSKFKEKTSVLKDKLTEATQLIENLTEQLLHMSNEGTHLKGNCSLK